MILKKSNFLFKFFIAIILGLSGAFYYASTGGLGEMPDLKVLENQGFIQLPPKYSTNSNDISTFQNFEIKAHSRNELMDYLKTHNISTIKQWAGFSIAHFSKLGYNLDDFPLTRNLFDKLLLLPLNHMMTMDEAEFVSEKVLDFYSKYDRF